jgi:hypothetical protein
MFVSALSLGPRGWIQITSFMVTGVAFLLFSRAVKAEFPNGKASRAGPIMLALVGVCLFGSGPFVMDLQGIPFPDMTWHSKVHHLLGAVVFSLGPASPFVFFRRFRRDPRWRAVSIWSLAAGVVMVAAVVLLKLATLPPPAPPNALQAWAGAIQRVAIVGLMAWVSGFAWVMAHTAIGAGLASPVE